MRHNYYTICSAEYLYKGLVLYESMKLNDPDFKLFLVCLDDKCAELVKLLRPIDMIPMKLSDIKDGDKTIKSCKATELGERYTLGAKASAALYLFQEFQDLDHLVWIDCQVGLLSDPSQIFEQWNNSSILLLDDRGHYNRTFMGFKSDEQGMACLNHICSIFSNDANFAEQNDMRNISNWQNRFNNITILKEEWLVLTPEQVNHAKNNEMKIDKSNIMIRGKTAVMHYFEALKYYDGNSFDLSSTYHQINIDLIRVIYMQYIEKCKQAVERLKSVEHCMFNDISLKGKCLSNYFNYAINANKNSHQYNFCSSCDKNSLINLLIMYYSLKRHRTIFKLWVCCRDDESYETLKSYKPKDMEIIHVDTVVCGLQQLNTEISSLKHVFPAYILKNNFSISTILSIDNNYFFFDNPKKIFAKLGNDRNAKSEVITSRSVTGFIRDQDNSIRYSYSGGEYLRELKDLKTKKNKVLCMGNKVYFNESPLVALKLDMNFGNSPDYRSVACQLSKSNLSQNKKLFQTYLNTLKDFFNSYKSKSFDIGKQGSEM